MSGATPATETKSTTLLLASSKEVGVKATAGMVETLSVEAVSVGFFEVHFENRIVAVRANKMKVFFHWFLILGMIGIDGLKLREKYYFNNSSNTPLISLSLGLGASSLITFPFLSINIYLGIALILNCFFWIKICCIFEKF